MILNNASTSAVDSEYPNTAGRDPARGAMPALQQWMTSRNLPVMLALLSVVSGTLLIVHTYTIFSQTYDESAHIACGMEWLDRGTYQLETLHPPLARVATAFLPFLSGARFPGLTGMLKNGNAILNGNDSYQRNLTLARVGILPFFWLACFLVWRAMAREFNPSHAAIAVFLFAFCPVVLGHSGLATTDAALMAMFLLSVLGFQNFLAEPALSTAILAGVCLGLGLLTKFTEIPFFLVTSAGLFLYTALRKKRVQIHWRFASLAIMVACLVVWAGYRFEVGPVFTPEFLQESGSRRLAPFLASHGMIRALLLWRWVPAQDFFRGIYEVILRGGIHGGTSYLLGKVYSGGRWEFFPVALVVKSPIALLIFVVVESVWLMSTREWKFASTSALLLIGVASLLLICMCGNINIGVRHILPVYPFLAMLGAGGAVRLWSLRGVRWLRVSARVVVALLLGWSLETCLHAAPDLFPYFNEISDSHASYFLVDSDLDWGQDLHRLSVTLRQLGVQSVSLDLFETADLDRAQLPDYHVLQPGEPLTGWVAISEFEFRTHPEYLQLENISYIRVGRSIRLYRIDS